MSLVTELQQKVEAQEMLILDARKQNDLLKAENAKLWERVFELEKLTDHRHYIPQEWYATLKVENAKLRELVRIAIEHCDSGTCDGCPIQGESGSCPYSDMARELGIEVDNG